MGGATQLRWEHAVPKVSRGITVVNGGSATLAGARIYYASTGLDNEGGTATWHAGVMTDRYAAYPSLRFERPAPGVLHVILDGPGLNAVDPDMHRELADVWLTVDRDPDVRVAMISGAGRAFSAGGSFELIEGITNDYEVRTRVLRAMVEELADLIIGQDTGPRSAPASSSGCWPTSRSRPARRGSSTATPGSASRPGITPRSAGRCSVGWPRRSTTCSPAGR